MSFLSEFFGILDSFEEQRVCCPFEHQTQNGVPYFESNPSAYVNTEKGVFHCKSCGRGYNQTQFIEHTLGCKPIDALRLLKHFDNPESKDTWFQQKSLTAESKELANNLGIADNVLQELGVMTPQGRNECLQFPVFLYGQLLDIRTYTPGASHEQKMRSRTNSMAGLILPYDVWRESPKSRITLLCAGEKDMAVARSKGFNAITITGGEKMTPRLLAEFKDRVVCICYDNDDAGISGARIVANALTPHAKAVKIVSGFHQVCTDKGEDITDFFVKYQKTKEDLIQYIEAAEVFMPSADSNIPQYPYCSLLQATQPNNVNKMLQSNVQVVAVADTTFTIPTSLIFEKYKAGGEGDTLRPGDCRTWELNEDHLVDALHLMDSNLKEEQIKNNLRTLAKVPLKEKYVKQRVLSKTTIFKAYVTDMFETNAESAVPMEFTVYSFGVRLESGQKYKVIHKLVPHPYKGQQLVMLVTHAAQANDSVSDFALNEERKTHLAAFQALGGTITERMNSLTEKVKGLLGYNGNNTLIQAIDLAYHTVLEFHFGNFKHVRGYLDTLVVGESRVGKSSTANTLRQTYGLGVFTSLAGNSATIPGLIGGSNKTSNGFQTRAGVIPQNHRGLVIFEEFGKCKQDIVSELTDIRSSNEVRIARVSGTVTMPALVRMLALTNVKAVNGSIKPIAAYPNGISVITELVGTAEDIARYDLLVVLSDRGNSQIDPFWQPETPMDIEAYRTRVRWVWSRTPDQVQISREVGLHIMQQANAMNAEYDCHIKIFGTEAWKKIARLAIAIAGYTVSADETYENIVVTEEHVDYAVEMFKTLYDNSTFKLREYVLNERLYSTIDDEGIAALQDMYTKAPALLLQLEKSAVCSKNMLASASGLTNDDLNKVLSRLTKGLFIRYQGYDIVPTERFRIGIAQVDKQTVVSRVGE